MFFDAAKIYKIQSFIATPPLLPSTPMAVHISAATGAAATYNGRVTTFVVISCVMAGMGGVIFGYDIGISGK